MFFLSKSVISFFKLYTRTLFFKFCLENVTSALLLHCFVFKSMQAIKYMLNEKWNFFLTNYATLQRIRFYWKCDCKTKKVQKNAWHMQILTCEITNDNINCINSMQQSTSNSNSSFKTNKPILVNAYAWELPSSFNF